MAIEMKVPAVGESITEVTVATWNKKEGDHVKLDEVLCELESDKATFELPAEAEGVLHIVAKEGDVLPIGAISMERKGKQLAPYSELAKAGCVAFSDDGDPVADAGLMRRALEWCLMLGLPLSCHRRIEILAVVDA